MVDELDGLDRVLGRDVAVGEADEVVAVLLLATRCEVRRSAEGERGLAVEVGDDELVMDDLPRAAAPFLVERRRDVFREVRERDEGAAGRVA